MSSMSKSPDARGVAGDPLERATSIVPAGPRRYAGSIDDAWEMRPFPLGGLVTAIAVKAMTAELECISVRDYDTDRGGPEPLWRRTIDLRVASRVLEERSRQRAERVLVSLRLTGERRADSSCAGDDCRHDAGCCQGLDRTCRRPRLVPAERRSHSAPARFLPLGVDPGPQHRSLRRRRLRIGRQVALGRGRRRSSATTTRGVRDPDVSVLLPMTMRRMPQHASSPPSTSAKTPTRPCPHRRHTTRLPHRPSEGNL